MAGWKTNSLGGKKAQWDLYGLQRSYYGHITEKRLPSVTQAKAHICAPRVSRRRSHSFPAK